MIDIEKFKKVGGWSNLDLYDYDTEPEIGTIKKIPASNNKNVMVVFEYKGKGDWSWIDVEEIV